MKVILIALTGIALLAPQNLSEKEGSVKSVVISQEDLNISYIVHLPTEKSNSESVATNRKMNHIRSRKMPLQRTKREL
jgi:hypothetical protein